jgi:hypothetical protein
MVYWILGIPLMGKKEKKMKIYRVIDNSTAVLTTFNELTALRLLKKIMEKHDVTWGWIDTDEVK